MALATSYRYESLSSTPSHTAAVDPHRTTEEKSSRWCIPLYKYINSLVIHVLMLSETVFPSSFILQFVQPQSGIAMATKPQSNCTMHNKNERWRKSGEKIYSIFLSFTWFVSAFSFSLLPCHVRSSSRGWMSIESHKCRACRAGDAEKNEEREKKK